MKNTTHLCWSRAGVAADVDVVGSSLPGPQVVDCNGPPATGGMNFLIGGRKAPPNFFGSPSSPLLVVLDSFSFSSPVVVDGAPPPLIGLIGVRDEDDDGTAVVDDEVGAEPDDAAPRLIGHAV